ncbi:MAG: Ni/Fe hydrogenase subunit alpha [Proteobacteria bacterium]|nr:Ni/Fe hydrogenase subunit alpha [Cystobacterineae bacterium]MCL2259495.1 Ni/Fe hydrogenase subunit alpha [Cystobacterineae bacterium]MCL2314095.1 Ni/Fe hydrogenase subunit alpha [Pseudomonadota bacterium]
MFELENAKTTQGLRRIAIEPVSRVEGHGKVTLLLDEHNKIHQVRLHIVEFRGFEVFIKGRPYWEVPVTVQRLCGICPVSHQLAACKAMDVIIGAKQLTPTAEKLRRLMHYGQIVQSNAVHFYHLASPDLLLGFDSEVAQRNIIGVALKYPDIAKQGILLRKYGQEVIHHVAGKRIHGTGAVPGGVNKALTKAERDILKKNLPQLIEWAQGGIELVQRLHEANPSFYNTFGLFDSNMMGMVREDGALDLYHGYLCAKDAKGKPIFSRLNYETYTQVLREEVKPWSYMKFPYIAELGPENGWYKVGPLARLQTCDFIPSPLAEAARQTMLSFGNGQPIHSTLCYHWARIIEVLHGLEVIQSLLEDPDVLGTDLTVKGERQEEGVGVIEAPRGILVHHYKVNEDDQVSMCNLIVSTTHNNQAMNSAIRSVAMQHLDRRIISEGLLNHIECAIRAYDPCLSCATHALGKMPLQVELLNAEGKRLSLLSRDSTGTLHSADLHA